jgi:DNA-binding GntR family transcriptional regulator
MQKIYIKLRNDITFGKFKPGEHLSENFLSQEYKISRASIREVIGRLATQGYLTIEPNRGAAVTKLSLEDIDIIYNVLIRCESYGTALFSQRQNSQTHIKKLEFLHKKMQSKEIKSDYKAWLHYNDQFHERIYKNCGSDIVSSLIDNTRFRIYRFRIVETSPDIINLYNRQHKKILETIYDKNEKRAEELMANHLNTARKHRFEVFKKFKELL